MAYIVKSAEGKVVFSVRYDDIPRFLEENPGHPEERLMRQSYENWKNRNMEPCYSGPMPDDSQVKLFRSVVRGLDEEFWRNETNVRFIREQGIVNINKSKDLPDEYFGLALVPISCHGLFDSPWARTFEILELACDVSVNGRKKYKRILVRRRLFGCEPKLYDASGHSELETPDNDKELIERALEIRLKTLV